MNSSDIEAARRLIAQFEGRTLGRHNSALDLRVNEVAEQERPLETPRPYRESSLGTAIECQRSWEYCGIGDYCRILPGDADPRTDLRWKVIVDRASGQYDPYDDDCMTLRYWEFEAVRIVEGRSNGDHFGIGFVWRRIK